jgi:hypothetical protein
LLALFPPAFLDVRAGSTTLRIVRGKNAQDINEKRTRTLAQQKIDSELLAAARLKQQGLTIPGASIEFDNMGRAAVDISTTVTDALLIKIRNEGGQVLSSYPQFKSVRAYLPLVSLETIAELPEVRLISRASTGEVSNDQLLNDISRAPQSAPLPVKRLRTREEMTRQRPNSRKKSPRGFDLRRNPRLRTHRRLGRQKKSEALRPSNEVEREKPTQPHTLPGPVPFSTGNRAT